MDFLMFLELL